MCGRMVIEEPAQGFCYAVSCMPQPSVARAPNGKDELEAANAVRICGAAHEAQR